MPAVQWPDIETAYDKVGGYDQDAINGFSEAILDAFLEFVDPGHAVHILDAMAGNGNLTRRLYQYCQQRGIPLPPVTVLELSHVQCALASQQLTGLPAQVLWGDVVTMEDYTHGTVLPQACFDRVMLKSGTHEIPLERQLELYRSLWNALRPGGLFVNLGFVFDDGDERDEFRDLTRFKDQLAGLESAVHNRHFLTRAELYSRLQEVGFVDIRCGRHVQYTIRTLVGIQSYFPSHAWEYAHAEMQAQQARSLLLRRRGYIQFQGDTSIMLCPGEITLATRPA
ncbi:MAG: class I SAM-dependent methyltransferase [Candidatus Tectimicrobiota bacterium]